MTVAVLIRRFIWGAFCCSLLVPLVSLADTTAVDVWEDQLRPQYYAGKKLVEDAAVLALDAPYRAEDAAFVPIGVNAGIKQTPTHHISRIELFVDHNPVPLVGRFYFNEYSGQVRLKLFVRVNAYSHVRAVAQTNNGDFFIASRFVKASGGCSAPASSDPTAVQANLGKMRLRAQEGSDPLHDMWRAELRIKHPNFSGLQIDQVNQMPIVAFFIKEVVVYYQEKEIFRAETDISISENPGFQFFFVPRHKKGELLAEVTDSRGNNFSQKYFLR